MKEERAKNELMQSLSTENLIEQWESTENNDNEYIPIVRGWLMDEFEKRFPVAFDEWLCSTNCADSELKNYIKKHNC